MTREKLGEEESTNDSQTEVVEETSQKKIKGLDEVRAELKATKEFQKGLHSSLACTATKKYKKSPANTDHLQFITRERRI